MIAKSVLAIRRRLGKTINKELMKETWIKLYRKLLDSIVFENEKLLKVWVWALLKATHQERQTMVGYQTITLKPGEFIFGRISAAEELKMSEPSVRRNLKVLIELGNLAIKSTNKFSIITVKNWTIYQESGQQMTNKRKTNDEQKATDNNGKNDKNVYNKKISKDGQTMTLYDGTEAIRRFGEWVDTTTHVKLDRNYYKELP